MEIHFEVKYINFFLFSSCLDDSISIIKFNTTLIETAAVESSGFFFIYVRSRVIQFLKFRTFRSISCFFIIDYLGCRFNDKRDSEFDIKPKTEMARTNFVNLKFLSSSIGVYFPQW